MCSSSVYGAENFTLGGVGCGAQRVWLIIWYLRSGLCTIIAFLEGKCLRSFIDVPLQMIVLSLLVISG